MTVLRSLLIFAMLLPGTATSEQPASDSTLRDFGRIKTEGNTTFTTEEIQRALASDAVAQRLVDETVSMDDFADVVAQRVAAGYQHGGFPDAVANGRFDQTMGQVTVDVSEGPRVMCGQIVITGVDDAVAEAIRRRLSGKHKREASSGLRWRTQEVANWKAKQPASFAESNTRQLSELASDVLRQHGYPFAAVRVDVVREEFEAHLNVGIQPGAQPTIDQFDITGLVVHTADEVLDLLELKPGMVACQQLQDRVQTELLNTGRFLWVNSWTDAPFGPDDQVTMHIQTREFDSIPRLGSELTPVQQQGLKLAAWLQTWKQQEEDLSVELRVPVTAMLSALGVDNAVSALPESKHNLGILPDPSWLKDRLRDLANNADSIRLHVIISPDSSSMISVRAEDADGEAVCQYDYFDTGTELMMFAVHSHGTWSTGSPHVRFLQKVELTGQPPTEQTRTVRLNFSFGFRSSSEKRPLLEWNVTPAVVVDLLQKISSVTAQAPVNASEGIHQHGSELTIGLPGGQIVLNDGRLVNASVNYQSTEWKLTSAKGLLKQQIATSRTNAAQHRQQQKYATLSELMTADIRRSPIKDDRLVQAALNFGERLQAVELSQCLAAWTAKESFRIPEVTQNHNQTAHFATPLSLRVAGILLPVGSMPHRIVSALEIENQEQRQQVLEQLVHEITTSANHGPVTCWLAATAFAKTDSRSKLLQHACATAGLQRFNATALADDLQQIMRHPGLLREDVSSLVRAIRSLSVDEAELCSACLRVMAASSSVMRYDRDGFAKTLGPLLMAIHSAQSDDIDELCQTACSAAWDNGLKQSLGRSLIRQWKSSKPVTPLLRVSKSSEKIFGTADTNGKSHKGNTQTIASPDLGLQDGIPIYRPIDSEPGKTR